MTDAEAAAWLRTPGAVRSRAQGLLALGEAGKLPHFTVDASRLEAAADYVTGVIRQAYPTLAIPHHARWRHFAAGGIDRWGALARTLGHDASERARTRIDLAVVSVLLDAGAGPDWAFVEPDGSRHVRSEGLGIASLHAFQSGLFGDGMRTDAATLSKLDADALGRAFQVSPANPLTGLEGRAALLRRLGAALAGRPDLFGPEGRPGGLFDVLPARELTATALLGALLDGLGLAWPPRLTLGAVSLGDVGRHSMVEASNATAGYVPFHKLSQWLAYSLIEVFEEAGRPVHGLDALTGLPEYRNGGLFLDLGVLAPRDPSLPTRQLSTDDEAVVEWRALTVALLDRLAPLIRARLGRTEAELPLSRLLEGGTWAAGRAIAAERRPGGAPPLTIASDGTVF